MSATKPLEHDQGYAPGVGGASKFRTSFTYQEGNVPAIWVQGKVVNTNLVNWTVDVAAQFDRKRYFDIQVAAPYLHYSNGEGVSCFPEVGAKCMVCIPSDSSPPFVGAFLMPVEVTDMATPDAPKGTTSKGSPGGTSSGASYAGGRPQAKPGDISLRTRDDNFVILHRGGVVQIGASELAQRIYIPLTHLIMDVSQNYAHHNAGGSVLWGLQEGPGLDKLPTEYSHCFRVFANNKSADVRVKIGKVSDPLAEPPGADGNQGEIDLEHLGAGDNFIVAEVTVAPEGFNPETGSAESSATQNATVLRFFFDRAGGTFLRCKGSLVVSTKKRLVMRAAGGMDFQTDKEFSLKAKNGVTIDGGAFTSIKGGVVRLGPGAKPVAVLGSLVSVSFPYTPMPIPGSPPLVLFGTVTNGTPTVLA